MPYVEQSHQDLRLYITNNVNDLKHFSAISAAFLCASDYHIQYGILQESHYVIISHKNFIHTEFFACTTAPITEGIYKSFDQLISEPVRHNNNDYSYSFNLKIVSGAEKQNCKNHIMKQIRLGAARQIFSDVRDINEDGVTEVLVRANKNIVEVTSIHTYPNESVNVYSTSLLTIA